MFRYSYVVINLSRSWNDHAYLSVEAISEVKFCKNNVSKLSGISFWPSKQKPPRTVYFDTSDIACGSFIPFESRVYRQNWSDAERRCSSTYRELSPVLLSLEAFSKN